MNAVKTFKRENTGTLDVVNLSAGGIKTQQMSVHPANGSRSIDFPEFPPPGTEILSQFIFGGCRRQDEVRPMEDEENWPVTWVHGDGCGGNCLSGMQAQAVSNVPVVNIEINGRVVGRAYEDDDAEYCHLGGVMPVDISRPKAEQARSLFEQIESALAQVDMDFLNVVRTWFYIQDMLDWYAEFNKARTTFFNERKVFDHYVPASTGIGGSNLVGAAISAAIFAIRPKHDGVTVREVPSPLQCPATDYRSSFSRAAEVQYPDRRHLYISGTASIDSDGNTVYVDDTAKQIKQTMDVCEAILESRGMEWSDTTRMIAYFKDFKEDQSLFTEYCQKHGLAELPAAYAHATVCRPDLLFEVELDAVK
ncbi:MAG: RidA family protein [Planctomycetota bacterium]|nr:RidA family protein [Planctomycetota bacterium]